MATYKRLFFDVPGFGRVNAMPGGSIKLPGVKREMVMADTGPVGPSAEPTSGALKFKLPNQAGLSLSALGALNGINVTVQDDAGKTWLCSGAFVTEPPELSGGEIDIDMQFERAQEVL